MPIIDLKKMPKSKPRLIVIQATVIFCIIALPFVMFGTYFVMKEFIWGGAGKPKDSNVAENKKSNVKELKTVFNISTELKDGWGVTLISAFGKKTEANRQVYFTLGNTFNSVNIKVNEVKKVDVKPTEGQANNGFQNTELVEINDVSSAVTLYEDLAGQKIARVTNPIEPTSVLYIDLNSKKVGEKDLKAKTPQPDKFFYSTKLNLFPELSKELTDRDFLVTIQSTVNKPEEIKDLDEMIKNLKVTN
jgi:hypothetical protein